MGGRFGGPLSMPRTYKAKFELRRERERMAERMNIPVCPSCGVHCSVCQNLKHNGSPDRYSRCCLNVQHPGDGEFRDWDREDLAIEKREKQE